MYEYIGVILVHRIRFDSLLKCVFSEICPVGFQFDSVNKICVGCMLGYYKDVEGNSVNCSSCPVNKITANVNSTSVDACSIGKWLYVCHLWQEKDTASVNSTSVDACSIGDCMCIICDMRNTQPVLTLPLLMPVALVSDCMCVICDMRKTQPVLTLPLLSL